MRPAVYALCSLMHTTAIALALTIASYQPLPAQTITRVTTLTVGGFPLRLGMPTQELLNGIGQAFRYVYSEEHDAYLIRQPDGRSIASVLLKNGRVVSISKIFELDDSNDIASLAIRAYKEFETVRQTTTCSTQAIAGEKNSIGQMVNLDAKCGNVTLTTDFFTQNEKTYRPFQTGFSISIR